MPSCHVVIQSRCGDKNILITMVIIIILLYYRLAEHINKYMSVVQYIVHVSTLSTRVGIQLLTMSVATMRRAHTATVSNENEFVRSTLHLKPVQL